MEEIPLNTWEEFETEITSLFNDIKKKREKNEYFGTAPLFRGQENSSWKLTTTLERFTPHHYPTGSYHDVMHAVNYAVESLTDRSWDISRYDEKTDESLPSAPQGYEFMVHIRHHGFPSPLLDWTRSPYVAAFFAFRTANNNPEEKVAIFSYEESPNRFKTRSGDQAYIHVAGPYVTTHRRHHIQQCEYTTCKKSVQGKYIYCSHEEAFSREDPNQDILIKYTLPKIERQKVLEKLDLMNINSYSLFGNEESLMDWLAYREIEKRNS